MWKVHVFFSLHIIVLSQRRNRPSYIANYSDSKMKWEHVNDAEDFTQTNIYCSETAITFSSEKAHHENRR